MWINKGTKKDMLFKEAIARITERERLGLPTVTERNHIYWQGDHNYSHLDMETIRSLSLIEFINDNVPVMGPTPGPHPNQYRLYDKALSWEEIEAIQDITK
tara:strand:- start:262 stop:564 length:303 start_codon:yes stop_codon:yes gene_type:complete